MWRGYDLPNRVELLPEPGRAYTVGVQYLVFPANEVPPFVDDACGATTRYTEQLAALRPSQVRTVTPPPAVDADLPWEWLIAVAALAGVATTWRVVQDRRRAPPEWDPHHEMDR